MTDFDPQEVPIRAAATVMLIDDRPDLQVFMMERNANTIFAGGMWVFPGGAVDPTDDPSIFESISTHRPDADASALMGLDHGGLAYYVAAIREAFEEAGVLLALNKNDHTPLEIEGDETQLRFDQHRDIVNRNGKEFINVINKENLILDAGQMHYVARWVTPLGPPRRFDARFFISRMPSNQQPRHDDDELIHSEWLSPKTILERFDNEEMVLMSPTLRMIKCLAKFESADQVIKAAASNFDDERARVNSKGIIVLPGDKEYDTGDETVETGWVRLRPIA